MSRLVVVMCNDYERNADGVRFGCVEFLEFCALLLLDVGDSRTQNDLNGNGNQSRFSVWE